MLALVLYGSTEFDVRFAGPLPATAIVECALALSVGEPQRPARLWRCAGHPEAPARPVFVLVRWL